MKPAIFHDFFGSIGGGEKLVLELAKAINADIITAEVNKHNLKKINKHNIKIINIGNCINIPIIKHIHASIKFSRANFPNYRLYIMSGCWSIFAAKKHKPNLLYCHTPVRMFYDSYKDFYKQAPWWGKWIFALWVAIHRHFLESYLKHINKIIANSKNTQKRIKKYYKRQSTIIYPPIKQYKFIRQGDFWLSVNRLYPHKRIELQLDTFKKTNQKLVIVGGIAEGDHSSSYVKKIKKQIPKNVTLLGEVDEKELEQLYGNCKAFITTSKDEDFGMTVLEAMSAGKPVVAVDEGGYKETVTNKTGYLTDPNTKHISDAITKLSKHPAKFRKSCEKQAKRFSAKIFTKKLTNLLRKHP